MKKENYSYKSYTKQAKSGIRGEAFFETLICEYCLPHHVIGPKDLGIDYFCEWVFGDKPSGILFAVQIKHFSSSSKVKIAYDRLDEYNGLEKYEINHSLLKIKEKTLNYWKGLKIPLYLFVLRENIDNKIDCYYKRYTPYLTENKGDISRIEDKIYQKGFYKVNKENNFIAFKHQDINQQGFARDLFIDYIRCNYSQGSIIYLDPKSVGLEGFPDIEKYNIFPDLFKEYKDGILDIYAKSTQFIKEHYEEDYNDLLSKIGEGEYKTSTQATPTTSVKI